MPLLSRLGLGVLVAFALACGKSSKAGSDVVWHGIDEMWRSGNEYPRRPSVIHFVPRGGVQDPALHAYEVREALQDFETYEVTTDADDMNARGYQYRYGLTVLPATVVVPSYHDDQHPLFRVDGNADSADLAAGLHKARHAFNAENAHLADLRDRARAHAPLAPIDWVHDDFDGALKRARTQRKPLLVFVNASWDTATNMYRHENFERPEAHMLLAESFVALDIDVSDDDIPAVNKLKERLKIIGVPTLLFVSSDGMELSRLNEYTPPPSFLRILERMIAKNRQRMDE